MDDRPMFRTCTVVTTLALAALPAWLPAQQSSPRPLPRTRITSAGAMASRCAELTSSPTMLLQAPEGRALLRFKRELDAAAGVIEQRGDSNRRIDIQRITQVQRGVDSLMQIIVRIASDDGTDGRTVTLRGDSVRVTVNASGMTPRALFESTDGTMRLVAPNIEASIRSLQPQIAAFSEAARTHLPMRVAAPAGWLGMHLSESKITMMSPEGALTNYCDYPVIEAVDAGSPAEKGGLNAGDTVVAYNGRDVRTQAVNYAELLVPGQQLRMRVRHAGRVREVPVTVAARPAVERNVIVMRAPCAPGAMNCDPGAQFNFSINQRALVTPTPPAPPVEMMLAGTGMAVIAGAQLSVVDDEFAQSLGVEPGVLVLRVPPGTLAADAGLRPGDVIRAVNGTPLREMAPLRRAFSSTGTREVRLTVSARGAAPRIVTMKW
jgi:hypothetical protein